MKISPRRRGRPTLDGSEALSELILSTAAQLFRELGFAATSIEQIAAKAHVGKHTIYRRYPSKEKLFVEVLNFELLRFVRPLVRKFDMNPADPIAAIRSLCRAILLGNVDPLVVDTYRVAIAEAARLPEMATLLRERGTEQVIGPIAHYVRKAQAAGLMIDGDAEFLAGHILLSIVGFPFISSLLGAPDMDDQVAAEAYFERAWPLVANRIMLPAAD